MRELEIQIGELEQSRNQLQSYAEDLRRTYTELRWWLGSLNALHEASTTISAALDEELVLKRVLESLARLVPHTSAQVYLASDAGEVHCRALFGGPTSAVALDSRRWHESELGRRLAEVFERSTAGAEAVTLLECAVLIAPLRARGRSTGLMVLLRSAEEPFTQEERRLVELVSAVSAVALENARLYQETQRLATVDPLTDLYNYRYFHQQLAQEIARAKRLGYPLGVLMADLDHFKQVNDQHGHPKADEVLREVARVASAQLRSTDVLARLGGEEFGVILPNAGPAAVAVVGQKLCNAVAQARVPDAKRTGWVQVTMSIGGVSLPAEQAEARLLVDLADQALFRAKQAGRNRVVIERGEDV